MLRGLSRVNGFQAEPGPSRYLKTRIISDRLKFDGSSSVFSGVIFGAFVGKKKSDDSFAGVDSRR